ncbi:hypothetical protein VPH35_118399 [Triticum aestivum]|uniref:Uncharacterized protein n=1 Tax=Aegilops tauschii TaxID=37682 RepID=M8B156_AEGTA
MAGLQCRRRSTSNACNGGLCLRHRLGFHQSRRRPGPGQARRRLGPRQASQLGIHKVFGICYGSVPFPLDSIDPVVVARVLQLRSQYLGNGQKNIQFDNIVTIMKNDETEEGFIRSFLFLFISSVFSPTSWNYANWKILYGLHDISKLKTFDLGQLLH